MHSWKKTDSVGGRENGSAAPHITTATAANGGSIRGKKWISKHKMGRSEQIQKSLLSNRKKARKKAETSCSGTHKERGDASKPTRIMEKEKERDVQNRKKKYEHEAAESI